LLGTSARPAARIANSDQSAHQELLEVRFILPVSPRFSVDGLAEAVFVSWIRREKENSPQSWVMPNARIAEINTNERAEGRRIALRGKVGEQGG